MGAAIVIMLAIFIYNVIKTFINLPRSYLYYRKIQNSDKGYKALTLGLTAVAAGDTKVAAKQAQRTQKFLKNDNGLPLLLKAQAARMQGHEEEAIKSFTALIENKEAGFLGVRGLLQAALDHNNHGKALDLARQALKIHPKQPWILNLVYDLEIKECQWDCALKTLGRAKKLKTMSLDKIKSDKVALLIAKSDDQIILTKNNEAVELLEEALRINPGFSPSALRLAQLYSDMNKPRKARLIIEKCWRNAPHPDLAHFWISLIPAKKSNDPIERMRWFSKLYKLKSKSTRSNLEAGHVAMKEGLWEEARGYLLKAETLEPTAELYKMLRDLERMSAQGEEAAQRWDDLAKSAMPAPKWICRETGCSYKEWSVIAMPHGSFNTIEWGTHALSNERQARNFEHFMESALIEAPR